MPDLIITKQGLSEIQKRQVGKKETTDYILHVFTNDKTPAVNDILTDYTEVDNDESYIAKPMNGESWIPEIVGETAKISYPRQIFSFAHSHTLFGIYITTEDNVLVASARFEAAPYNIPATGGIVNVDTGFTDSNKTEVVKEVVK